MVTVKWGIFLMGFDIRDYWLIWEDALRKGDRYREILVTPQETRFRLIHDLDVNTYLKKRIPGTPQPEALNFEITRFRTELRKSNAKDLPLQSLREERTEGGSLLLFPVFLNEKSLSRNLASMLCGGGFWTRRRLFLVFGRHQSS